MTNEELDSKKLKNGKYRISIRWGLDIKEVDAEYRNGLFTNWHTQVPYPIDKIVEVLEFLQEWD